MFIALDESYSSNFTVIGCLVLPKEKLPDLEKEYIQSRLDKKLWGEIKWSKATECYWDKYKEILGNYLSKPEVTFHSWCYKNPTREELNSYYDDEKNKPLYKHSYLLIRNVIRKCRNMGYKGDFYIVPDTTGRMGKFEYSETQKILKEDTLIYPRATVEFCAEGNSQVCGALQIADLCIGAVRYTYEREYKNDPIIADEIVKYLTKINEELPINYSHPTLPKIEQFKMHHCLFIIKQKKWVIA